MSVSRKIQFNALPESVRRRWAKLTSGREQPGPLHVEPLPSRVMSIGFLALLGLAMIAVPCWYGFGMVGEDLYRGGKRTEEARVLLGQRTFDEALAQGTVTALRTFLTKYPDRQGASLAVHKLDAQAMAAFTSILQTSMGRSGAGRAITVVPSVHALAGAVQSGDRRPADRKKNRLDDGGWPGQSADPPSATRRASPGHR